MDCLPDAFLRLQALRSLVGNTPLLEIHYLWEGLPRRVFAKAEHLNLTGSIKDRMALHILEQAVRRGELEPGAPLFEATSGNTGISFAALGSALGHPVTIFLPDWMSRERVDLIRSLGATIRLVRADEGGFVGAIALAEQAARAATGGFLPRQFANQDNVGAHERATGAEILAQLAARGLRPHAFVAGVGTGGTVMGVGRALRARFPDTRIHPLEPASSPTLSTGCKSGSHRIQGISDEFVPPIVDLRALDRVLAVDDGDAIRMAQALAASLGLGVGISSGANFLGAVQVQEELGGDAVVVTVFPDSNKKYLSTDLNRPEPARPEHWTDRVRLTGYLPVARTCVTCRASGGGLATQGSCPEPVAPPPV